MIILDTNVLSAIMQDTPDPRVTVWLDEQPRVSIWSTAITVYELSFGIQLLTTGRKRSRLEKALDGLLEPVLDGRILPFDRAAAEEAGRISAERRRAGRTVEIRDVQIAGIAVARKAQLATRNIRHFSGLGLTLVDPWSA